ncbi:MAG: hypothetical protein ABI596_04600 [Pyrinomonadaceae bacterium]
MNSRILYENLDTSFVNLWAMLRFLMKRGLVGRVHVELEDYTADVFLTGTSTPLVHEVDRASGREAMEEAALHRLVLRAREPGGTITVYEGEDEASGDALTIISEPAPVAEPPAPAEAPAAAAGSAARPIALPPGYASASAQTVTSEPIRPEPGLSVTNLRSDPRRPALESAGSKMIDALTNAPQKGSEWADLVEISAALIAAVERASTGVGADFSSIFKTVRLELADDYTFLDPSQNRFDYANARIKINAKPGAGPYVAGISESLRRVVDKIANEERAGRVRERVALDLALLVRKRREALTRFNLDMQLDRIAGTRVL